MALSWARMEYFLWALSNAASRDLTCPSCGGARSRSIRRKALVTVLRECSACGLRFRTPKDRPEAAARFYQNAYRQGYTTDCPSDTQLERLLDVGFRNTERDYSAFIEVLLAAGLKPGDSIVDFGCSWGYGSWQLREAGFNVYSYEISAPRAAYAASKLKCNVVRSLGELSGPVKCFFSAHVIEHMADPNVIWRVAAQVLDPEGLFVCFTPNGRPEAWTARDYHMVWGKVHPMLWTPQALAAIAERYGFTPHVFSSPYEVSNIALRACQTDLSGPELLLIASGKYQ